MTRTHFACVLLLGCAHFFTLSDRTDAQIPLPLARHNYSSWDTYAYYELELNNFDTSPGWQILSFFGDYIDDYDVHDFDYSSHSDITLGSGDSGHSADGFIELMEAIADTSDPYLAVAAAYASFGGAVNANLSDPNDTRVESRLMPNALVAFQVEVQSNQGNPTAGVDANSATLYAEFYLNTYHVVDGRLASSFHSIAASAAAVAPGSSLFAYPLCADYTTWYVEGSLSQSTSANPTATPLAVADTFYDDIDGETWYGTEVTQVGAIITLGTAVSVEDFLIADNVSGGASPSISQYTSQLEGIASVHVLVP